MMVFCSALVAFKTVIVFEKTSSTTRNDKTLSPGAHAHGIHIILYYNNKRYKVNDSHGAAVVQETGTRRVYYYRCYARVPMIRVNIRCTKSANESFACRMTPIFSFVLLRRGEEGARAKTI